MGEVMRIGFVYKKFPKKKKWMKDFGDFEGQGGDELEVLINMDVTVSTGVASARPSCNVSSYPYSFVCIVRRAGF
jgi:hypothetical protein